MTVVSCSVELSYIYIYIYIYIYTHNSVGYLANNSHIYELHQVMINKNIEKTKLATLKIFLY